MPEEPEIMWVQNTVKMMFDLVEMVFDKIRWNVMGIAVIIAYLIVDFGNKLIDLLADNKAVEPELIITVIVGLIGTGIGGLIIAMGRMFDSPSVPADVHERMLKDARKGND